MGVLAIPPYWLQHITAHDFQSLSALCIAFGIVTLITTPVLNVYIPYCMRKADTSDSSASGPRNTAMGGAESGGPLQKTKLRFHDVFSRRCGQLCGKRSLLSDRHHSVKNALWDRRTNRVSGSHLLLFAWEVFRCVNDE